MKQKIGTMKPAEAPVSDKDMVFLALYNLLEEKISLEPKKGIVFSKGNPNQRKATWKEISVMAHALEDYFIFKEQRTGCDVCQLCKHWESISEASPHMGQCNKKSAAPVHAFSSCKGYQRR